MWHPIITMNDVDFGQIKAFWIAPDGGELLLLTGEKTIYWRLEENRALWTIREKNGGDGISPDGRLYRDQASGLFYPLLGSHGGRQLRRHPSGGHISVEDKTGIVAVTDPGGDIHVLSRGHDFGDWLVAGFCESGDHVVVADPCRLVVYV